MTVKWKGLDYSISVDETTTLGDLKTKLYKATMVSHVYSKTSTAARLSLLMVVQPIVTV